jgi:hypothetical protein
MTFPTGKVALATNVSTCFTLQGIVSRSTVALKFDESRTAIDSGLCFDRFLMRFPKQKRGQ